MKKFGVRLLNSILTFSLVIGLFTYSDLTVYAERTKAEVQEDINRQQEIIDRLDDEISSLTDEQDIILEQMDDLNAEIINMMASISLLEEEITQKEQDIAVTQQQYEEAKKVEEDQLAAMMVQIKISYEGGKSSWFSLLLDSQSFSDMLNRITYAKSVQEYNDKMLAEYENTKNQVHDLWEQLETEKAELQTQKMDLEDQKKYCDELMTQLKAQSDNFDALISQAESKAKNAKNQLKADQAELKKIEEEEKRKAEEERRRQEALNKTYTTTSYTELIDASSGSDLGKKIAKFGCQYIGNRYVYGGTSLTDGIDCSGFTYKVYQNFGYTIPRTSYQQRSTGKEVAYADAQPGDLICYSGHVGLYIGGGYIVHASSSQPYPRGGIKVSKATYRKILSVRRVIE